MDKEVKPLFCCKLVSDFGVFFYIHKGNLNWFQCLNLPTYRNIVAGKVVDLYNAPDTISGKQLRIIHHKVTSNRNVLKSEICKGCFIEVSLIIKNGRYLIYDSVSTKLSDSSLYLFCFSAIDVIIPNDVLHSIDTVLNEGRVISRTILSKKIFQYVCWYRKVSLDQKCQVFPYNLTVEGFQNFIL